jgi:membrane protein YqaA with SNARE-associated domain
MAFSIITIDLSIWTIALITFVTNILGAIVGFFLGKKLGHPVCVRIFGEEKIERAEVFFRKWGKFGVFLMAFTPLPFKVACWGAGIFEMRFLHFLFSAILGRAAHFLFVIGATHYGWKLLSTFI